ncbi:MAG: hypothetical protein EXS50_03015 [Candidatus Taylorbacteria bacterium]|nr:hypothetical protein [Candidatus Taylorbacteria bacterium]
MSGEKEEQTENIVETQYTVREFFETVPPSKYATVIDMREENSAYRTLEQLNLPEILLFCGQESCNGERLFENTNTITFQENKETNSYARYRCKNCEITMKVYSLSAKFNLNEPSGTMFKFGEYPQFGPPTPAKVVKILGLEREYYFKGRQSENQGLGIAAFAYYRRVVENQKDKIFDEIIHTVKKISPEDTSLISELEAAKRENQFSKAVESIKHAIPQIFLIDGNNPLTLLHSALSEGLHGKSDKECLEIATSIRVVLTEMVERMSNALKDSAELKSAVGRILRK